MKPERWQQIDKILEAALEREECDRADFLEEACAGDEPLRKEVESLLTADKQAENLMEAPAAEMVAEGFARDQVGSLAGRQIASYKILSLLGAGGMGEVYLAQDSRLDRKVALKFLPEELQQDSTSKKRFLREARSAAALDHPFICHIHEVGEAEGKSFISMEYVQGETLKDKLAQGPLPLNDALGTATEIAEGLEAAHKQNIVHRDLKPSNIMLTPQGHVKVMDFGLAKRVTPVEGQEQEITTALTKQGSILGTVPYMSPEQVRGQAVDMRSDIFSFGVVLYEMLTGVNPLAKGSVMDTATAILSETPPPLTRYTEDIPVLLQHTVKKMLAKEPDRRYQLIHDVRTNLGELIEESGDSISQVAAGPSGTVSAAGGWRRAIPWSITGLTILIAGLVLWNLGPTAPTSSTPAVQPAVSLVVALPANEQLTNLSRSPAVALSPDGTRLAYTATRAGIAQLYLHSMDEPEAEPVAGTENARSPFFSPDGQWLGFFAGGKLKKVSVSGGTPVILCDVSTSGATASWVVDDTIVLSAHSNSALSQVPAGGGTPQPLTTRDSESGEGGHFFPQVLPGGKAVLFTVQSVTNPHIAVQSLETGERRVLLEGVANVRYVPTGHLVYAQAGTLMAVAFHLEQLEVTGDPIPILEGVMQTQPVPQTVATGGIAHLTFSDTGILLYVPADTSRLEGSTLVWVDRQGAMEPLAAPPRAYGRSGVDLSPDGQRVAVAFEGDTWVYDILHETLTRLTFEGGTLPLWTPEGKRITFQSTRFGTRNLFWKAADGTGAAEPLLASDIPRTPHSWSPDGKLLAFTEVNPSTNVDIWMLPLEGERKPEVFLRTPFSETGAVFSPDGHWLAYRSNESGRQEIYVQPYPPTGGRWQISTEGGEEAVWASSGRELFYRNGGTMMMAVDITTEPTFTHGTPQLLFEGQFARYGPRAAYDVTSDGQRFVMIKPAEGNADQINVILNWFEELKRLVPTDN